jgi:hypothetical protein
VGKPLLQEDLTTTSPMSSIRVEAKARWSLAPVYSCRISSFKRANPPTEAGFRA